MLPKLGFLSYRGQNFVFIPPLLIRRLVSHQLPALFQNIIFLFFYKTKISINGSKQKYILLCCRPTVYPFKNLLNIPYFSCCSISLMICTGIDQFLTFSTACSLMRSSTPSSHSAYFCVKANKKQRPRTIWFGGAAFFTNYPYFSAVIYGIIIAGRRGALFRLELRGKAPLPAWYEESRGTQPGPSAGSFWCGSAACQR